MAKHNRPTRLHLRSFSTVCVSKGCERATQVAETAHSAADALLSAYELARTQRGRPRGMTTDNEQDLLRSMLVMASAGLDATVKQLIQDALQDLIVVDAKALNSFEKFVARRLSGDPTSGVALLNTRLLAAALTSSSPQRTLIGEYVSHLTGGSLQSVESLFEVAAALGAEPLEIGLKPAELKPIFDTRNTIIHELDINLEAHKRTRNVRSQTTMIRHTNRVFELVNALIASVDSRLAAPTST